MRGSLRVGAPSTIYVLSYILVIHIYRYRSVFQRFHRGYLSLVLTENRETYRLLWKPRRLRRSRRETSDAFHGTALKPLSQASERASKRVSERVEKRQN